MQFLFIHPSFYPPSFPSANRWESSKLIVSSNARATTEHRSFAQNSERTCRKRTDIRPQILPVTHNLRYSDSGWTSRDSRCPGKFPFTCARYDYWFFLAYITPSSGTFSSPATHTVFLKDLILVTNVLFQNSLHSFASLINP